jgi:hypothetical protein
LTDAKFIFATPTDRSEVIDHALAGFAFFVRDARAVRFARLDADVTRSCPR